MKFGAKLTLVEASREEEINEARGQTEIVARGELQQYATWTLSRETHPDEEKQFLLVVERPAAVAGTADVELIATVVRRGETMTLSSRYVGNPLELAA